MSASRVIRRDGSEVPLEQLAGEVSASLFQTDLHYDVCARVARLEAGDETLSRVLHNLLALKSPLLRGVTVLMDQAARDPARIRRVVLPPLIMRAVGGDLATRGIQVEPLSADPQLVPRSVAMAFAMKAVLHRLYRLAARPLAAGVPVVRAWVDVTDVMYGDLYESTQVRVYPFSLGLARQRAYVRSLRERGVRWSFDGVPYRWRDAAAALLPWGRRHLRLARGERLAYERYAGELLAAGVPEVHTSDEFEVGAVAAGERLRAGGAAYVNTAHGTGLFCPQVAYSRLHYVNDYQARFYRRVDDRIELCKRSQPNSRLPFTRQELEARQQLAVVYVHQNTEAYNLPAESAAQRAVMGGLAAVARELGITAAVKLHPNTPLAGFKAGLPDDVRVVARWDELREWRPVFLTLYSTAYFELAQVAPVLVYSAPTFRPEVYLDGDFETFTHADLADKLRQLGDPDAWRRLVDRQRQTLEIAPA